MLKPADNPGGSEQLRARVLELEAQLEALRDQPATEIPPRRDGRLRVGEALPQPSRWTFERFVAVGLRGRPLAQLWDDLYDGPEDSAAARAVHRLLSTLRVAVVLEEHFPALPVTGIGLKGALALALQLLELERDRRANVEHQTRTGDRLSIAFDAIGMPRIGTLQFTFPACDMSNYATGSTPAEDSAWRDLQARQVVRSAAYGLVHKGAAPGPHAAEAARQGLTPASILTPPRSDPPGPTATSSAPTPAEPTIGQRLRLARSHAELSRNELARKLNCSAATVKAWEHDRWTPGPTHQAAVEAFLARYAPPRGA